MNSIVRWWFFFRIVVPVVGRVIGGTLRLVVLSFVTLWSSVPAKVDEIAVFWAAQAINNGWPTAWDRELYFFFKVTAWVMFLIGYVLSAFLTIFIIRLIF